MTVVGDVIIFFHGFAKFLWCSRRQAASAAASKRAASEHFLKCHYGTSPNNKPSKRAAEGACSSDSTDFDPLAGSTVSSDSETSSDAQQVAVLQPAPFAPPPGLAIPSDLTLSRDAQCQQTRFQKCATRSVEANRLNVKAEPFVPHANTAAGIHSTIKHNAPKGQIPCALKDVPPELQNVLDKLSAQDAKTVRILLGSKGFNAQKNTASNDESRKLAPPAPPWPRKPPAGNPCPNAQSLLRILGPAGRTSQRCDEAADCVAQFKQVDYAGAPTTQDISCDGRFDEANSLRSNLRKLAAFDEECILHVKKINKLGLDSADRLKDYFAVFGPVERVFVTHSIEKGKSDKADPFRGKQKRVRAAGGGFVVMKRIEDVAAIFQHGPTHIISGVPVHVGSYECRPAKEDA